MADNLKRRTTETKYNQVVTNQTVASNDSTTSKRTTGQTTEVDTDGTNSVEGTRTVENGDIIEDNGQSQGIRNEEGKTISNSERTAETTRDLRSKSTQVTRDQTKANIAFQVSFTIPIRSTTPLSPDSSPGNCQ